jgi:hypothetical protein
MSPQNDPTKTIVKDIQNRESILLANALIGEKQEEKLRIKRATSLESLKKLSGILNGLGENESFNTLKELAKSENSCYKLPETNWRSQWGRRQLGINRNGICLVTDVETEVDITPFPSPLGFFKFFHIRAMLKNNPKLLEDGVIKRMVEDRLSEIVNKRLEK